MDLPGTLNDPPWLAAAGTGLGYAILLGAIAATLFALPFLAFRLLGVAG
ncbi:MAG: hypothetical protein ABEJ81_04355 [Haloferacaceae archaeon]